MEPSEKRSRKVQENGARFERKSSKKVASIICFLKQGHITTTYKKENSNNRPLIETKQPLHPFQANT